MNINDINPAALKVKPSAMRDFDREISSDPKIVKLTLGEPNFNVPEHIKQATIQAVRDNDSHYPYFWGHDDLRQAASKYYKEKFGYNYDENQIVVTVGATEAVMDSVRTLFAPGDGIIILNPSYPLYDACADLCELNIIHIDTSKTNYILTPESLQKAIDDHPDIKVKGFIINDPNNPTGVAYSEDQLKALVPVIKKNNLWVLSDEIYGELTYGVKHYSLSQWLPDQTIIMNGLSKSHAMTGYRLGFIFGPNPFINQIAKVHQFTVTTPASIVQDAASEALNHGQNDAEPMRLEYDKRRKFVQESLNNLGFNVITPGGAFYIYAVIPASLNLDSWAFVKKLAKEYHIGIFPGAAFGDDKSIRISYAASDEALKAAMKGISQMVKDLEKTPS